MKDHLKNREPDREIENVTRELLDRCRHSAVYSQLYWRDRLHTVGTVPATHENYVRTDLYCAMFFRNNLVL